MSKFNLQSFHYDIIDLIIFDSIIGNGDRHQENWGFITDHTVMSKRYVEFVRNLRNSVKSQKWWIEAPSWLKYLIKKIYFKGTTQQLREEILFMNFTWNKNIRFAPIYDNGSSLARELS